MASPGRALAWAVMLWVVLNLAVALVKSPTDTEVSSGHWHRDQYRGWAQFVMGQGPPAADDFSIIVVGNSQSRGWRLPAELSYPALVHRQLEHQLERPVDLRNWSPMGGSATETRILVAAALRLKPDLLIVATSQGRFAQRATRPEPADSSNDIYRLLAYGEVRRELPLSVRRQAAGPKQIVDAHLARFFPVWRYREDVTPRVLSWLGLSLAPYGEDLTESPWRQKPLTASEFQGQQRAALQPRTLTGSERRKIARPLDPLAITGLLQQMSSQSSTSALLIDMPVSSVRRDTDSRELLSELAEASSVPYLDATSAVADHDFFDNVHFTDSGHREFARQLVATLAPLISRTDE